MKIADYEAGGRERYDRLATAVHKILKEATDGLKGVRVQQIQHRAKDVASLRKKMAGRGVGEDDELEQSVKDLAGCRIILYTNADVSRLRESTAIRDNFEVDWDRTKIHYPFDETDADQLFVSYNYVLKLADKHLVDARAEFETCIAKCRFRPCSTTPGPRWRMTRSTSRRRPASARNGWRASASG